MSANLLQRKYFPENVNEKFDPDKIYDRVLKYVDNLHSQIFKLTTENKFLKRNTKDLKEGESQKSELI